MDPHYLESRIALGAESPLNILEMKERLEIVRQDPLLRQLNAELKSGALPSESYLDVGVEERDPFHQGLRFDNHRAPSIGAERLDLVMAHQNLTGNDDRLAVEYGITRNGLDDIRYGDLDNLFAAYHMPVTPHDTTIELTLEKTDSLIVEEPFDDLDVTSESLDYGITIRHPVYRTSHTEFAVSLMAQNHHNETFLLGEPFSLSSGADDGDSELTVLRLSQKLTKRSQQRVVAARSTFSFGLDVLGATDNTGNTPDGEFVSWLGQFQYVTRIQNTDNLAIFKINGQLTSDPLLSMEQFSIVGFDTVRGYRKNQIVRDQGGASTVDFRIPMAADLLKRQCILAALIYGKEVTQIVEYPGLASCITDLFGNH